jgi:glycosyltransferase involved in cell wall biosynthesis
MSVGTMLPEQPVANRQPHVSIVVPTFKRAALLRETVASILVQTFEDFELIIVDNMSDDGTEAWVGALDDARVRYFRNANGGVIAVNRNFGIKRARGQYIALCDDDDLWTPDKLEKQVAALERNSSIGMCYANASTFDADGPVSDWMMKERVFSHHYRRLLTGNFIPNSAVLIRRSVIEECGYFNQDPRMATVEDYEMWLKIARRHDMVYIDEPLLRYRLHAGAMSNSKTRMARRTLHVLLEETRSRGMSVPHLLALARSGLRVLYFAMKSGWLQ